MADVLSEVASQLDELKVLRKRAEEEDGIEMAPS